MSYLAISTGLIGPDRAPQEVHRRVKPALRVSGRGVAIIGARVAFDESAVASSRDLVDAGRKSCDVGYEMGISYQQSALAGETATPL